MTKPKDQETTCAGVGNGYWYCDVPGGCRGCRHLARDIEDWDQVLEWNEERKAIRDAEAAARPMFEVVGSLVVVPDAVPAWKNDRTADVDSARKVL